MKIKSYLLIFPLGIILSTLTCCQCNKSTSNEKPSTDTMDFCNVTILLDLSNRIDPKLHPDQIQRDTLIINDILKNFSGQVKRNGYLYSKDRIQVLIAPQAQNKPITFNPNIDITELAKSGKIIRQILPELENQFRKEVNDIYASKQIFSGADIYTFFKDYPSETFIQKSYEEKSADGNVYFKIHNKMIILTDGYLNFEHKIQSVRCKDNSCMQMDPLRHDNNWHNKFDKYKLKPIVGKDFSNLEVLLLEANPFHPEVNINESEIIECYWKNWFQEMNINYKPMHQANEGIPLITSTIKSFMTIH